ncbi:MAG: rhodanese-like domain-containing protein [Saprospiraceae bacterium]|nr:rhodanese-like domain-containing protein [Saprospiraceae bacterium]
MDKTCEIPRWQLLKQQIINLSPADFVSSAEIDQHTVLVDVRTELEWQSGSLDQAIHIDYLSEGFLDVIEILDRSKSYYLFCRTGRRSIRTGVLMKNWGFKKVINLDGGLTAWEKSFGKF